MFGPRVLSEAEIVRLPRPAVPGITPTSFTACPVQLGQAVSPEQWAMQQQLYQLAFEQAQAEMRPSLPDRDLLAVWN